MHTAILGIGSNINPNENIHQAIILLSEVGHVDQLSEIKVTKPIGITDQPDFSNGAVLITTDLNESELTDQLKLIENKLGRDRSRPKFGPREIDLDIVIFDDVIVDEDYHSRDFLKELVDSVWFRNT
ncbi:2-amino-4-hydroxy-6-hydroxymethyldihydropteridine diphosphokinase [Carboxylicivirga linearis]|uniref:2-amino-4-hydroxy-6-hydroxymethyldihydropteridine pyrophosphokinase n=1 Tax=Carboxylicivirga linearis TaxID=1628157 RepID=A0ABS5JS36_9BACT|nr:2-amino-4-hydroxy-6-hydroxymethyldihydropteridine diphosphokinase [Carboxylicivirga linearis]MBS2097291.1 2-amino-4-hydroxy-6-hydroxymethyldihydropteridine diphosphokinase [Carboxylicivirga linearis]